MTPHHSSSAPLFTTSPDEYQPRPRLSQGHFSALRSGIACILPLRTVLLVCVCFEGFFTFSPAARPRKGLAAASARLNLV